MYVFDMELSELRAAVNEVGLEPFRANQVFNWLYKKRIADPELYTDISKEQRLKLKGMISPRMEIYEVADSVDGSSKFLLKLPEGDLVETVLMRHVRGDEKRYTVCVSTQLGCPVGCKFCASGRLFKRSLSAGEIVEQVWQIQRYLDETEGVRVSNVVYMGMGEPLFNYQATLKSLRILSCDSGLNISTRNITISTVGIPDRIRQLADDGPRVKLALSLHSPREDVRREIIPLAKRYSLRDILDALSYYWRVTRRRITIEYVMLKGVNDSLEDVELIVRMFKSERFKGMRLLINLIPYNWVDGTDFEPSDEDTINAFAKLLSEHFDVTVRRSMGADVSAACGQLRYKRLSELGSERRTSRV